MSVEIQGDAPLVAEAEPDYTQHEVLAGALGDALGLKKGQTVMDFTSTNSRFFRNGQPDGGALIVACKIGAAEGMTIRELEINANERRHLDEAAITALGAAAVEREAEGIFYRRDIAS